MPRREKSVYSDIAKELENRINAKEYKQGQCLPSERELKEQFGVERTTVRRALTILCEKGLIYKHAGIGSVVSSGKPPKNAENAAASSDNADNAKSAAKKSSAVQKDRGTLIWIFPDAQAYSRRSDELISKTYEDLSRICAERGLDITQVCETSEIEKISAKEKIFGAVFCEKVGQAASEFLESKNIPYILAFGSAGGLRCVDADNSSALELAVSRLYTDGHRKIAFVGSDEIYPAQRERRIAFEEALTSFGLSSEFVNTGGGDEESGYKRTMELLRRSRDRFTAVCAVNDAAAKGALRALTDYGIKVPSECSVIGFGAVSENTEISSTFCDCKTFAREIFHALCSAKEGGFGITCRTVIGVKLCGNTVSEAVSSRSRGSISDFLL